MISGKLKDEVPPKFIALVIGQQVLRPLFLSKIDCKAGRDSLLNWHVPNVSDVRIEIGK